jgi:hypothetical protein
MNVLMVLGMICTGVSLIFTPGGPFRHLKSTLPQIYAAAKDGKLREPLAVQILSWLGIVLFICGLWRQWS